MNSPCSFRAESGASHERAGDPGALAKAPKLRKIATSLGTLEFFGSAPTQGTVRKVYDNLDLIHAVDAFIRTCSSVSQYRLREAQRLLEGRTDQPGKFQRLTALTQGKALLRMSRFTAFSFIDLERLGPTVVEIPPGTLGVVKDMWFRIVGELGLANTHAAANAKYLLLPPDHSDAAPAGYVVIQPRTYQVCLLIRAARALSESAKAVPPALKVYSLSAPVRCRQTSEFNNNPLRPIVDIAPDDRRFFEDLHRLVQEQPLRSLDGEKRSLFASVGITKGKPFRPSARMRQILRDAIAIGSTAIRAMKAQQSPTASNAAGKGEGHESLAQTSRRSFSLIASPHPSALPRA
jgi:hypothetical protein